MNLNITYAVLTINYLIGLKNLFNEAMKKFQFVKYFLCQPDENEIILK